MRLRRNIAIGVPDCFTCLSGSSHEGAMGSRRVKVCLVTVGFTANRMAKAIPMRLIMLSVKICMFDIIKAVRLELSVRQQFLSVTLRV
ncbi:hypothetical protein EV561_12226 [Rhizobium sp. BK376]|nr:hypothetical protein EV561_12226 [Rhizobium sp. BK376]